MGLSIIVAADHNWAIGYNNKLLWRLSSDLKNFKRITTGHPIIMGRKTFESLPNGPLPNRDNIVLSRTTASKDPNCIWFNNIESLLEYCTFDSESFVIGGGEIYSLLLPYASKIYLSVVDTECQYADTWFPRLDMNEWVELSRTDYPKTERDDFGFTFIELLRK